MGKGRIDVRFKTLLAVFALVAFAISAVAFAETAIKAWGCVAASAKVIAYDNHSTQYQYRAKGSKWTAECYTYVDHQVGKNYIIYYDPNAPMNIIDGNQLWGEGAATFVTGLAFTASVFSLRPLKRWKQRRKKAITKETEK